MAHIVQQALDLGLNLQTWTPATSISGSAHQWTVHTDRGSITTSKVVHTTNAYAGFLLPEVRGAIHPTPHMYVCPPLPPSAPLRCFPLGVFNSPFAYLLLPGATKSSLQPLTQARIPSKTLTPSFTPPDCILSTPA